MPILGSSICPMQLVRLLFPPLQKRLPFRLIRAAALPLLIMRRVMVLKPGLLAFRVIRAAALPLLIMRRVMVLKPGLWRMVEHVQRLAKAWMPLLRFSIFTMRAGVEGVARTTATHLEKLEQRVAAVEDKATVNHSTRRAAGMRLTQMTGMTRLMRGL